MGIDLPQPGVAAQPRDPGEPLLQQRVGRIVQPRPHGLDVVRDEPRALDRFLSGFKQETRIPRHAVLDDKGLQCAAVEHRGNPALHRRREAALRMRQRHVHLVGHPRVFDEMSVDRIDVIRPHGQPQRPDHRHGQHHVGRERFD